jgi:hypothetical protein
MTAAPSLIRALCLFIPPFRNIDEVDYLRVINFLCQESEVPRRKFCNDALAFVPQPEEEIDDILFVRNDGILETLCKQCCNADILDPGQPLVFLCHNVPPERYCVSVDKALVSLLGRIPVAGIFQKSHRQYFLHFRKEITKNLQRKLSNLDVLDRYFESDPPKFKEAIQRRFSLLRITLEVYHWRHNTIKVLCKNHRKNQTLLSARDRFNTFVSVESEEMELLMNEFLAQLKNVQHEMRLYKGYGYPTGTRRLLPNLRFVPRFWVWKRPTRAMFQTFSVPGSLKDNESKDMKLAARLSPMLFGNILEGQACSVCLEDYHHPLPWNCSGYENSFRSGCEKLRTRIIKSLKPFQLHRALELVVAKFISSYDTDAIHRGLWQMSHGCLYNPRKPQGRKHLSRFLNILSAFAAGMAECQKARIVQIQLRRCFLGLEKYVWDCEWAGRIRFAEWFLLTSNKHDLIIYFGLAATVEIDCFDFEVILNEMVSRRHDVLRELAEEPFFFSRILEGLGKLEGKKLDETLDRVFDMITGWKDLQCGGIYKAIQSRRTEGRMESTKM